jgi:hypothetical protein
LPFFWVWFGTLSHCEEEWQAGAITKIAAAANDLSQVRRCVISCSILAIFTIAAPQRG